MSTAIAPVRVTLRNGLEATIRLLRPDDRGRMAAAVRGLDAETIYTRLFSHRAELTEAGLDRLMRFDPDREAVLVVTIGADTEESIVGGGRYVLASAQQAASAAEIAFTVEEDYHGLGIAGRLLQALTAVARDRDITRFEADVLSGNPSMLRVFERSGLPMRKRSEGDVVHVELELAPQPQSDAR
jgi:RimJ/RimL family protein N-acetyltransferase